MTYFSLAQLPRSRSRQRSLQNGNSNCSAESVGFLQMGQLAFTRSAYRKQPVARLWLLVAGHGRRGAAASLRGYARVESEVHHAQVRRSSLELR